MMMTFETHAGELGWFTGRLVFVGPRYGVVRGATGPARVYVPYDRLSDAPVGAEVGYTAKAVPGMPSVGVAIRVWELKSRATAATAA